MIVTMGGVLSIYLGWKLYRDGIISAVESNLENQNGWKFTLKSLGPGVFFALFGMWILVTVIGKEVSTEKREVPLEQESSLSESDDDNTRHNTQSKAEDESIEAGPESASPTSDKISFWMNPIPSALARTAKRPQICLTVKTLTAYNGDVITSSDFQSAIKDAISALRAGSFDTSTQNQANNAISILARVNTGEGSAAE